MVEVNISRVFRTKIDERIYSFDIIAVNSSNLHSSLIGYCIVNTREDSFIVELNVSIGLSNKQFNKMIFYESLMLSLKSLLFGFLIFILIVSIFLRISMINENTFDSLLDLPLSIFIPPLIVCIIGVIVIVYLSFLIATHKIKKDNIVDILKVN